MQREGGISDIVSGSLMDGHRYRNNIEMVKGGGRGGKHRTHASGFTETTHVYS